MNHLITNNLATWTTAPNGIKKLRELILELAVRGLLVPQDPNDESASALLTKIAAEKARLVSEGKIKPPKPLAKISEEEKPFDLPIGWELVRLQQIIQISSDDGLTSESMNKNGSIPVYGGNGITGYHDKENTKKPTLVIGRVGYYCGSIHITPNSAWVTDNAFKTTFSEENINISYLFWLLKVTNLKENEAATAQPVISGRKIYPIVVGLPPLAEQHRIVAKVDELMQLCDQLEQKQSGSQETHRQLVSCLLTTLTEATDAQAFQAAWSRISANFDCLFTTENSIEQLKQTILQLAVMGKLVPQNPNEEPASELLKKIATEKARLITEGKIKKQNPLPKISEQEKPFALPNGWEWERIGTIFNGGSGTTPLRSQLHYFINGTENWFKTTDLNLNIVLHGEEKITKLAVEECNLTYYPKDTVCIAMYGGGGTIGKSGMLGVSATINQSVFALPPIEQFNSYFLHLYIKSIRSMWMGFAAGLRKDPNINGLIIKKMLLPIPPLAEQHRIVAKVDELMTLCDHLKTKLATSQALQQQLAETLVQQAVA